MPEDFIREALAESVSSLQFDAEEHQYWMGDKCLPNVTGVLESAGYTSNQFADEAARDRGARVHNAISDMEIYDLSAEEAAEVLPESEKGYVISYGKFKTETGFRSIASEQRLMGAVPLPAIDTLFFAGTADLIGFIDGDELVVIDCKTSRSLGKHVGYQLAGYEWALGPIVVRLRQQHGLSLPIVRLGLRLDQGGGYSSKQLREFNNQADSLFFAAALTVMYAKRGRNFYRPEVKKVKIIDTTGQQARVTFPFEKSEVDRMRKLGFSSFWNADEKAYLIPFNALSNQVMACLEQAGYEVR